MVTIGKLKLRWFLIYAGFGALLSIIVTFVLTQLATEQIRQQVGQNLGQVAWQMADKLERGMFERFHDIGIIAELLGDNDQPLQQRTDIPNLLATQRRVYPEFAWLGIVAPNGEVLHDMPQLLSGVNVSARPWFQQGLHQHYVGDLHTAKLLQQLLSGDASQILRFVDFSAPIVSNDGELLGVVGSHLDWRWAEQVKQSLATSLAQFKQAEMLVVTQNDEIILGPAGLQESHFPDDIARQIGQQREWSIVRWGETDYLVGTAQLNGYRDYPGLQWRVLVREPLAAAYTPVVELRERALMVVVLVALLFAGVGWIGADRVSKPLANSNQRLEAQVLQRTAELNQRNAQLEQLAHTDNLTNLPNHRAFFERAERTLQQAMRRPQPLVAVMLDLDHFKLVNDRYGHSGGDDVLREVGALLAQHVRAADIVARTGGEEFSLLLQGERPTALAFAERLREALAALTIQSGEHAIQVTMSIGLAQWQQGESLQQLLHRADEALYLAKESGRNRCQWAEG